MRAQGVRIVTVAAIAFAVVSVGAFGAVWRANRSMTHDHASHDHGNDGASLHARFTALAAGHTNQCGGGTRFIAAMRDDERIQGSCCSAMELHRYEEQIDGLQRFASLSEIPPDPYDVPVAHARQLLAYRDTIALTPDQQTVYDEAARLSHEGGPCCCTCWHWDAYEGLAKHLITQRGFTAQQIADVWDLSDACGGSGHEHGDAA